MDKDGNLPEWLRLPHSLAESGDPIEGNPYPKEHPAYQVWIDATRRAEGEVCRIDAEASSSLTPANADDWLPALAVSKFDVWARRGVKVVWTDAAMRQYDRWLLELCERLDRGRLTVPDGASASVSTRTGSY